MEKRHEDDWVSVGATTRVDRTEAQSSSALAAAATATSASVRTVLFINGSGISLQRDGF